MSRLLRVGLAILFLSGCQAAPTVSETFGASQLSRFSGLKLVNPIALKKDPYNDGSLKKADAFCGVKFIDEDSYRLDSYLTAESVDSAGAHITHKNACGTCSSLRDLAVYARHLDLTRPVRRCALVSWYKPAMMHCLQGLGFTEPCAETWFYNARHTAKVCGGVCLKAWIAAEPMTKPSGELNDCLACDEALSGPQFKTAAGRTRRNSGLPSAIPRRADEIYRLEHNY